MPFKEENKSKAYRDSDIIADNEDVIFVRVHSYDGVKYFGPDKMTEKKYDSEFSNGNLYFIFDKKDPYPDSEPHVYTILVYQNRDRQRVIRVYNHLLDEQETLKFIYNKFPSIKRELDGLFLNGTFYETLKGISEGRITSESDVRDSEDLVRTFRFKAGSPSGSMIEIYFDNSEDFLNLIPFDNKRDNISYIENIMSNYYDFRFNDSETYRYDWKEGYILRTLNDVNIDKLNEIIKIINPKLVDENIDEKGDEISETLYNLFENEIDNLLSDYEELDNECKIQSERETIKEELCDILEDYGIFTKYCFSSYYTTVKVLLHLYETTGMYDVSLQTLLTEILKDKNIPDFWEYYYETHCRDWPDETWQRYVSDTFDRILEKVEESDEYFSNLEEYRKILDFLQGKYKLGKKYTSPTNPNNSFRIEDIDHNTNKIKIIFWKLGGGAEARQYNLEDFKVFLSTGELF